MICSIKSSYRPVISLNNLIHTSFQFGAVLSVNWRVVCEPSGGHVMSGCKKSQLGQYLGLLYKPNESENFHKDSDILNIVN